MGSEYLDTLRSNTSFSYQQQKQNSEIKKQKKTKQYSEPTMTENICYIEQVIDWDKRIQGYTQEVKD